jgi:hypothetical protein
LVSIPVSLTCALLLLQTEQLEQFQNGAHERPCRCFAINLQCRETWKTPGSDSALLKGHCQVLDCDDEAW